ncbi:MAG: hypothetical protein R3F49_23750 [Planctomycetota bacterium]
MAFAPSWQQLAFAATTVAFSPLHALVHSCLVATVAAFAPSWQQLAFAATTVAFSPLHALVHSCFAATVAAFAPSWQQLALAATTTAFAPLHSCFVATTVAFWPAHGPFATTSAFSCGTSTTTFAFLEAHDWVHHGRAGAAFTATISAFADVEHDVAHWLFDCEQSWAGANPSVRIVAAIVRRKVFM